MSQTKTTNKPKHPCGNCGIGVKYSSIKCTGPCNLWFHGGCVNLTDKKLKKLTTEEITSWTCQYCQNKRINQAIIDTENNMPSTVQNETGQLAPEHSDIMNGSRQDLEQHLLENTPLTQEDNLILAAKVGSVLLEENEVLKRQNSKLSAKLLSLEAKIEELEKGEEKYLEKMEHLQGKIAEIELQRSKEKEQYLSIKYIFEEHDEKQINKLKEQEIRIQEQEKELSSLQLKLHKEVKLPQQEITSNELKHSETQTDLTPSSSAANTSSMVIEIGLLKKSQTILEERFKVLETKLLKSPEKNNETISQNTCFSEKTHPVYLKQNIFKGEKKTPDIKIKRNIFSVSLQVNKYKEQHIKKHCSLALTETTQTSNTPSISAEHQCTNIARKPKTPPCTADKLKEGETLEEFYQRKIEKYQEISVKNPVDAQSLYKNTLKNDEVENIQTSPRNTAHKKAEILQINIGPNKPQDKTETPLPSPTNNVFLEQTQYQKQRYRSRMFHRSATD